LIPILEEFCMHFRLKHFLACAGLAGTCAAGAATITPAAMGNWSFEVYGDGTSSISGAQPRNGNGSIEITLPMTDLYENGTSKAEVDWYYELPTPLPLSQFSSATYEWYRDSASANNAIQAPALALVVDNDCDATTKGDQGYLIYEPVYQQSSGWTAPVDQWVGESYTPSSQVWGNTGDVWMRQLSAFMGDTPPTGATISGSSCIIGIGPFAGSGWDGAFHGFVDTVTLTAGETVLVNDNFELAPPPPVAAPTAVPTLDQWALGLMALLLGALGLRRAGRSGAKG